MRYYVEVSSKHDANGTGDVNGNHDAIGNDVNGAGNVNCKHDAIGNDVSSTDDVNGMDDAIGNDVSGADDGNGKHDATGNDVNGKHDATGNDVSGFQIGAGLYAVGRPVQKMNDEDGQIGTIQSLPLERGALFNRFFGEPAHGPPHVAGRGFWPYRGMSRRIPDRQPRLGLATCVRQK